MKRWTGSGATLLCIAVVTGCCGMTWGKDGGLLLNTSAKCEAEGRFLGSSSDNDGNRCETYELSDKTYGTTCDKSGPVHRNPSAQPYPAKR